MLCGFGGANVSCCEDLNILASILAKVRPAS